MLQSWLCVVGMIALPLVIEAVLAPRPCLWLLRGALPPSRRRGPQITRIERPRTGAETGLKPRAISLRPKVVNRR